jgi:catechol 2,3-dioxygenase-like lactoylglutathione lyase family enzyme
MTNSIVSNFEFKAIPTFRILDYQTTVSFYVDFLGFKIDWEHRFLPTDPVYMQISKNGLVLHLSENKRFDTKAYVFVETRRIKEFHKELIERNPAKKIQDIVFTNWQTMQLEIEDPLGNLLRFNENIGDQ